jgi:hypothetical protein
MDRRRRVSQWNRFTITLTLILFSPPRLFSPAASTHPSFAAMVLIMASRLDLTAPTQYQGPRQLLKEGPVVKTKSGRKLTLVLCNDILVLIDSRNLYRMVSSPPPVKTVYPTRLHHGVISNSLDNGIRNCYSDS